MRPIKVCERALRYFYADYRLVILLLVIIAISIALGLLQSWPLAILIDSVLTTTPNTDWLHRLFLFPLPHNRVGQIVGIAIIGMLMKITQDILTLVKTMLNNRINNYGVMRVRNDLAIQLKAQSIDSSEEMYRVCNDAQGPQIIFNVLLGAVVAAFILISMAAIMFSRSVALTLFGFSVTPFLIIANIYFGSRIHHKTTSAKEIDTRMVSLVKSIRFDKSSLMSAQAWLSLNWQQEFYFLAIRTIFSVGGAIVFGYGAYLVWHDQFVVHKDAMTVGTLCVFMDYLGKLWEPLTRLTGINADLQLGIAGAERVFEVLDFQVKKNDDNLS